MQIGNGLTFRRFLICKTSSVSPNPVSKLLASNYVEGQTWDNLVASPADGVASSSHSFYLGNNATVEAQDPAINSGPPQKWVFSSGDRMSLAHTTVETVPVFYRNLHHAGAKFSILVKCRWSGSLNAGICPIFDSGCSDFSGSDVSRGIYFMNFGLDGKLRLRVMRDSGGTAALSAVSDSAIPSNQDIVIGFSIDGSGAQPSFAFLEGEKVSVGGMSDFNGTYVTPGVLQTSTTPKLMARGDLVSTTNVVELYSIALYNTNLSLAGMTSEANSL